MGVKRQECGHSCRKLDRYGSMILILKSQISLTVSRSRDKNSVALIYIHCLYARLDLCYFRAFLVFDFMHFVAIIMVTRLIAK
jgi:hypothetical protein